MQRVFNWDLMAIADSMPTHLVNYMLSNGVVFENEFSGNEDTAVEIAARVSDRSLIMLDTMVWEKGANKLLRNA